jgi:hypothetical protein
MHLVAPESAPLLAEHTESLRARYTSQGLQLSQISGAADDAHFDASSNANSSANAGDDAGAGDNVGDGWNGAEPAAS